MRAKPPPGFMNVDLEILSRSKLDPLEEALRDTVHALFSGPLRPGIRLLSLECNHYPRNADAGIVRMCAAVERLGPSERNLWDRALSRTFDVGYSFGGRGSALQVALQPATLRRVVALGATVAFTCYPPDGRPPGAAPKGGPEA